MLQKLIYPSNIQNIQLPINLVESDWQRFSEWKTNEVQPAIYEYRLTNAYVSPLGLIFKNGSLVKESIFDMHKRNVNSLTFYKKILFGKVKYINESCIVGHHAWYDNYGHWNSECLPRIFALKQYHKDSVLILPEILKPYHEQILSFFDFKDVVYCKMDEVIKAKEVIFTNHTTNGFGNYRPEIFKEMVAFFKSKIVIKEYNLPNIYTLRPNAPKRRCVNEEHVLDVLKEFKFEPILMDNFTLQEQISIFCQAKNVVGVHASSFVNLMYMKPGGIVFDLIEKNHKDICFSNLANVFNIDYVLLESEGHGPEQSFRENDIEVDLKSLKINLNQFLR